ncbi:MAG: hypothetical protein K2O59_03515 [Lachnospiraceae bacterium]|nr:hypothetical protein [Lachnospiraceae bacterium]
MSTILIMMVIIFLLVGIVPFLQWLYVSKIDKGQKSLSYVFEQELLDSSLNDLRMEDVVNQTVSLEQMKNRGSVRIAQGLAFDKNDFEKRKQEEYAIDLP